MFTIGNLSGDPTLGSMLRLYDILSKHDIDPCDDEQGILGVAFGYGLGIVVALVVAAHASGGHFNPAVTVSFAIFRGFPWRKVPYFIVAQVFGAYCASMIVYGSWRPAILAVEAGLYEVGKESVIFTQRGTAGIFALYAPVDSPLGWVFLNEFFADFFIA